MTKVFPNTTGLKPFGDVQIGSIRITESTLIKGGRTAIAEPRGYGKTTRAVNAALWAIGHSYRKFVVIIGNTKDSAIEIMDSIKKELLSNDVLHAIFPSMTHCFRMLDGSPGRAPYQRIDGKLTGIRFTNDRIVFPSGSVIMVRPISSVRGMFYKRPNGSVARPDFVLLDDVQDDIVAANPESVQKLLRKIMKSVLKTSGLSKTLSCVANGTIIEPDDAHHQLLENPAWQSVRFKMLLKPSDNKDLWLGEYRRLREDFKVGDEEGQIRAWRRALAYYKKHRRKMDAGAKVSWKWAYAWDDEEAVEISAIQHAYNDLIDLGEDAFQSECQNDPLRRNRSAILLLSHEDICRKQTRGIGRYVIPDGCTKLYYGVDVQHRCLYYAGGAFAEDFTGSIIDYGTWPEQPYLDFEYDKIKVILADKYPELDADATPELIYAGLCELLDSMLQHEYYRADGVQMHLSKVLVDRGDETDTIDLFCLANPEVHGAKGIGLGPEDRPLQDRAPKKGEKNGDNWQHKISPKNKRVMYYLIDKNHWFSEIHQMCGLEQQDQVACLCSNKIGSITR